MRYFILSFYVVCLLQGSGCHPTVSCQKEVLSIGTSDLQGSWSYVTDDKCSYGHGWVLRGFKNNEGRLVFKFVKQFYDAEPVFVSYSMKNNKVEIDFELIPYDNGSDTKGQLKLVLTKANGVLQGKLHQGGKVQPVTLKKYGNYINTERLEGVWSVVVAANDIGCGIGKTNILKCFLDETGRPAFTFLRQYYSYEPVFTECSVDRNGIKIKFKLCSYSEGYDDPRTVIYTVRAEGDVWHGKLHESWRGPVDVTLVRLDNATLLQH